MEASQPPVSPFVARANQSDFRTKDPKKEREWIDCVHPHNHPAKMSSSILTQHVAPALGTLVALLLFLAPLKTLKAAMQGTRLLGDINPVPFPLLATNCAGWVAYGYLLRDYYVVVANINGLVLAMHYTLQAYCLCSMGGERMEGKRKLLHGTVVGASLMMAYVGLVVALPLGDKEEARKLVLGLVCNAVLVCFYASPLAEVKTVIASKSSDALVFPMCL